MEVFFVRGRIRFPFKRLIGEMPFCGVSSLIMHVLADLRRGRACVVRRAVAWAVLCLVLFASPAAGAAKAAAAKILSMSPAGTETLFALSLGDRLVGATPFCDYPPEALKLPRVASIMDLNLETLLTLSPDLVVLDDMNAFLKDRIEQMNIPTFVLHHKSLTALCDSIEELGSACGGEGAGVELADAMRGAMREAAELTKGRARPRVVVAVNRDVTDPSIRTLYIAGRGSVYDEMLRLAGGENAFETEGVAYPRLSAEGLLALDPDVIIDLTGDHGFQMDLVSGDIVAQWSSLPGLRALKEGRVYVRFGTDALHPGPRLVGIVRQFASFLHPELSRPEDLVNVIVPVGR